ncbi:DUF2330 domain-containing protein [Iamia sp. SCSIO 61187]|uniref:DUF2330 domain-containing protein n=1 Tax=Iamia sp. SCSIO 61187 TaxID=2722752 RepID=UPI001C6311F5|nr:DUF2330 domain-containing protein [Iamia sp. SCSIO 61187]QYG92305.1 DUF2330 domain-containing protein [Iamia sp. SCSIO 61187]
MRTDPAHHRPHHPGRRRRLAQAVGAVAAAGVATALAAGPAVACGGLVGENGTIELVRTTTLAAYHDGVERYVTSFEFTGEGEEVGSIIPLPDVPSEVVRGGDWTLQRLQQEVAPPPDEDLAFSSGAGGDAEEGAQVILEAEIDALDITVLEGGGDEVGEWAVENGFLLTPDAPEVLDFYAERSEIFMAARFDASRAAELGQQAGDGTPIMLTIPTDDPWVPLRILGLGLDEDQEVAADVFLLTDDRPQLLAGGEGLELARSEEAGPDLLDDLRSDVGMEWVPQEMWFTHLPLEADAGELDYDLAVSTDDDAAPEVADAGIPAREAVPVEGDDGGIAWWPVAVGAAAAAAVLGGGLLVRLMATPAGPAVRQRESA